MTQFQDNGAIYAGTVYFRLLDEDNYGFEEIGNTTDFKLTFASKTKERISYKKDSHGLVLNSVTQTEPTKLDMTIDTFNPQNMSMALMGNLGFTKVSSETVTDEIIHAQLGRWLKLAKAPIKASSVKVKLSNSSLIDSKKIHIDEDGGMIWLADNAGATKGEQIKVTYDTSDLDAWTIAAGTKTQFKCELYFNGVNTSTGKPVRMTIPQIALASSGSLELIGDEFNSISFSGTPELIAGEKSAIKFIIS